MEAKRDDAKLDGYIGKSELAKRLGKTPRTIESWMRQGILPFIKIGAGRRASVLFDWQAIAAALASKFGRNGAT
jgi:hypothetical protein